MNLIISFNSIENKTNYQYRFDQITYVHIPYVHISYIDIIIKI